MSRSRYVSERGDVVWLMFSPQAGHEQGGHRPAVVMSPSRYNQKTNLALCCPITSHIKGYPFEVPIPEGLKISGAILADHVRNMDWKAREAKYLCRLSGDTLDEVSGKILALLESE